MISTDSSPETFHSDIDSENITINKETDDGAVSRTGISTVEIHVNRKRKEESEETVSREEEFTSPRKVVRAEYKRVKVKVKTTGLNDGDIDEKGAGVKEGPCEDIDKLAILTEVTVKNNPKRRGRKPKPEKEIKETKLMVTYTCPKCESTFTIYRFLVEHLREKHEGEKLYECETCRKMYLSPKDVLSHNRKVHLATKSHICELCNKGFKEKHGLNRHMKYSHNYDAETDKVMTCTDCGSEFKYYYSLKQHYLIVHGDGENTFTCDVCGKVFNSDRGLYRHMKSVHLASVVGECEHCGKSFKSVHNMRNHIEGVHGTERNFQCEDCGMRFKRKQQVKEHHRNVHTEERRYQCTKCSKTYKKCSHLKEHLSRSHKAGIDDGENNSSIVIQEHDLLECEISAKEVLNAINNGSFQFVESTDIETENNSDSSQSVIISTADQTVILALPTMVNAIAEAATASSPVLLSNTEKSEQISCITQQSNIDYEGDLNIHETLIALQETSSIGLHSVVDNETTSGELVTIIETGT